MQALKQLPSDYYEHASLDLSRNKKAVVLMNLLGIPLLMGWGWLFIILARWLNPIIRNTLFSDQLLTTSNIFLWLIAPFAVIILHELAHGLFFWLFTEERPVYGYSWYYAYAGVPDWYFSKWSHVIISLAPLVLISLVGLMVLPFVNYATAVTLLLALISNATGAVGDIYITIWVLWQPPTVLIQDTGLAFTLYRKHP